MPSTTDRATPTKVVTRIVPFMSFSQAHVDENSSSTSRGFTKRKSLDSSNVPSHVPYYRSIDRQFLSANIYIFYICSDHPMANLSSSSNLVVSTPFLSILFFSPLSALIGNAVSQSLLTRSSNAGERL